MAAVLLGIGSTAVSANAEVPDLTRTDGTITLQLQYVDPETSDIIKMSDGTVSVYKVSDFVLQADGNYGFDISTGQFPEAEGMENLTERIAAENSTIASKLTELAPSKKGTEAQISNGSTTISDLQAGLFLMVQTKESPERLSFNPFLFTIPYDGSFSVSLQGEFNVTAKPKVLILEPEPTLPSESGNKESDPSETPTLPDESGNKGTDPSETPTSPTETVPHTTTPEEGIIPQTGQLWWPVPILFLAGFFLVVSGIVIRIKA